MSRLTHLIKAVCGIDTQSRIDGRPCPSVVKGWTAVAIAHDRRLSAGIFATRQRSRWRKIPPLYHIVVWRTYRDRRGQERATTLLHRDEVDPALSLLAKCDVRMPSE